jgi:short-subunit dehydrogenase
MAKVILITGASSGIGKACAVYLAQKGYKVYGSSRKPSEPTQGYEMLKLDVTDPASVQQAVNTVIEKEGKIDVLLNNAGMGLGGAIENFSEEEMQKEMGVVFFGMARMMKAVLPHMRKEKKGLIINVSSIMGFIALPFQGYYSASKFALEGLSEALRMEVKSFGINIALINPGDFRTGFTANRQIINAEKSTNPYSEQFKATLTQVEKDENGGSDPIIIAKKVEKIINTSKPAFHYLVGRFDQRFAVSLKKMISEKFFSSIIRSTYKLK